MVMRAFPVVYATDVERSARFWERLGFTRHFQLPADGAPGMWNCGARALLPRWP
jgi:hypothetical protein